jgi:hypothetical protein
MLNPWKINLLEAFSRFQSLQQTPHRAQRFPQAFLRGDVNTTENFILWAKGFREEKTNMAGVTG